MKNRQKNIKKSTITRVVVELLDFNERMIEAVEGDVISLNIPVDGNSVVRRVATLTFATTDKNYKVLETSNPLSISKKIRVKIGEKDLGSPNSEIVWTNMGVFVMQSCSITAAVNSQQISITAQDKMCLHNGEVAGKVEYGTRFDVEHSDPRYVNFITQLKNQYTILTSAPTADTINTMKDIVGSIRTIATVEDSVIEGESIYLVSLLNKYASTTDTAERRTLSNNIKDSINTLDMSSRMVKLTIREIIQKAAIAIGKELPGKVIISDVPDKIKTPVKLPNGDIGFKLMKFIYPTELVLNTGQPLTQVYEACKQALGGNFEYFYDTEGNFIFQEIQNRLDKNIVSISDLKSKDYLISYDGAPVQFDFSEDDFVTSYANNPNWSNIKNDFYVWGSGENGIIGYHVVIDEKPAVPEYFGQKNLVPVNRRNFEGWNIGTGSQTTTYKVPMSVFDSEYNTNYFILGDYINNGTSHTVGLYGRQITLDLLPNTQYIITTSVPGHEGGKNVFALNQGEQASSSVNGVMPSLSLIKTTDSTGKLIIATREVTVAQMQSREYWITVNKGTVAYSNQLSPQDLHNTSNPVTYNPSSDQYLLLEKAPLEALEVGYNRNLVPKFSSWTYKNPQYILSDYEATLVPNAQYQSLYIHLNLEPSTVYTLTFDGNLYVRLMRGHTSNGANDLIQKWGAGKESITFTAPEDGLATLRFGNEANLSERYLKEVSIVKGSHQNVNHTQAWEDLSDEQKLATRIRTKGGNSNNKLYTPINNLNIGSELSHFISIKNNSNNTVSSLFLNKNYLIGVNESKTIKGLGVVNTSSVWFAIGANVLSTELDIIAYNPVAHNAQKESLDWREYLIMQQESTPYGTLVARVPDGQHTDYQNFEHYPTVVCVTKTNSYAYKVWANGVWTEVEPNTGADYKNPYYSELKSLWFPDRFEPNFTPKADAIYQYHFDILDGNKELSKFSIKTIGTRKEPVEDKNIKQLYPTEVKSIMVSHSQAEIDEYKSQNLIDSYILIPDVAAYSNYPPAGNVYKDAYSRIKQEIFDHTTYNEQVTITALPIYDLDVNRRVYIQFAKAALSGYYLVNKINYSMSAGGLMTVNLVKLTSRDM